MTIKTHPLPKEIFFFSYLVKEWYTDIGPKEISPTDIGPTDIGPKGIDPTGHWSDETLVRRYIGPKVHMSDKTLVRWDTYRRFSPTDFFAIFTYKIYENKYINKSPKNACNHFPYSIQLTLVICLWFKYTKATWCTTRY